MKQWHRFVVGTLVAAALAVASPLIAAGRQGLLAPDGTIYVDADATGGANNGTSWGDAYTDLEPALAAALVGDQIWVAAGTYKPAAEHGGTGSRHKSFQMKNGVALYGGFDPSAGIIDFEDRDWASYVTILSGDIGSVGNPADNCYHVFYHPAGTNLNNTAILDGFSVTGGNASELGWPDFAGGAMFNDGSSPSLSNCTFSGNAAMNYGGGIYNRAFSSPLLTNCTFQNNASTSNGGGMANETGSSPALTNCIFQDNSAASGGGMWNISYVPATPAEPTLTNCRFVGNSSEYGAGIYNGSGSSPTLTGCTFADNEGVGIYNQGSSPTLANCTFSGNSADSGGGMLNRDGSSPTLTNCTFFGNSADYYGGGMYNQSSSPALTNCTFSGNSSGPDGGGGLYNTISSSPVLTNCILWGDSPQEIENSDSSSIALVTHSDVQEGYDGEGNIDADPRFVGPGNGDVHLAACSPGLDTGDNSAPNLPAFDFEGDDRIIDGNGDGIATVDMGVDEAVGGTCLRIYLPVVIRHN